MVIPWEAIAVVCISVVLWRYCVQISADAGRSAQNEVGSGSTSKRKKSKSKSKSNKKRSKVGQEEDLKQFDTRNFQETTREEGSEKTEEVTNQQSNPIVYQTALPEQSKIKEPKHNTIFVPEEPPHESAKPKAKVLKIVNTAPARLIQVKKPKQPVEEELTKKQRQNRKRYEMNKEVKTAQAEEQERRLREFRAQKVRDEMADIQRARAAKQTAALEAQLKVQYEHQAQTKRSLQTIDRREDLSRGIGNGGDGWVAAGSGNRKKRSNGEASDIPDSRSAANPPVFTWN
ncbi:uncharacterized protein V2V93DRAFT_365805 [Kockiozyma suomiensis]|uniref:uncharacterized protein n=1 Tax=Kockiozyma suomiensis TaxID=1337062 RepID=UPI00334421AE